MFVGNPFNRFCSLCLVLFVTSISNCIASTTESLPLITYAAKIGTASGQGLAVLQTLDQTGTDDDSSKYIQLSAGTAETFSTTFVFRIPSSATLRANTITNVKITVNSIGLPWKEQRRVFDVRNYETGYWENFGTNKLSDSWIWQEDSFYLVKPESFTNYFDSARRIRIRIRSRNDADVTNVDYVSCEVSDGTFASPTDSPTTAPTGVSTTDIPTEVPTLSPITESPTPTPSIQLSLTPTEDATLNLTESSIQVQESSASLSTSIFTHSVYEAEASVVQGEALWTPQASQQWSWQLQLFGTVDTSIDVDMFAVDLFDTSVETIQYLKEDARAVVCYFSAGAYESWRSDWSVHFYSIKEDKYYGGSAKPFAGSMMSAWDERWLDIREIALLEGIMKSRLELAVEKGCDAVAPDDLDAYSYPTETKLDLTYDDQLKYNRWLANLAHDVGISIGLKNDVEQLGDLVDYFDWAMNERCFERNECEGYVDTFLAQDKAVFGVEYSGELSDFCPEANELGMSWMKKDLILQVYREGCEDSETDSE